MPDPQISFNPKILPKLPPSPPKIAILATNEFPGFSKNGGIGTYYHTLSHKLAEEDWCVILMLCQTETSSQGESSFPQLKNIFSTQETEQFLSLQPIHQQILTTTKQNSLAKSFDYESFCCLFFTQAVSTTFPDAVIYLEFPEIWGFGYRTIQAKQSGLLSKNCLIGVTSHGSFEWLREANSKHSMENCNWFWQAYHYEQFSYENADVTHFPSHFLKNKYTSYGWQTDHAKHLPYFVPVRNITKSKVKGQNSKVEFDKDNVSSIEQEKETQQAGTGKEVGDCTPIVEEKRTPAAHCPHPAPYPLVFFGRLEERKGLCTFIEAVKLLKPALMEEIQLLFLGKIIPLQSSELKHLDSREYIEREFGKVGSGEQAVGSGGKSVGIRNPAPEYHIYPHFSSAEAIQFISELNHPLVFLTSLQENFPNAALEMGQLPVSLVVADTGGFRETLDLIARTEGVHWFAPGNPHSLAQSITEAIQTYPETPAIPQSKTLEQTNQHLLNQRLEYMSEAFVEAAPKEPQTTQITIGIPCTKPSQTLITCLESLTQQTYEHFDVVVVYPEAVNPAIEEIITQAQSQFPDYKYQSWDTNKSLGEVYNHLVNLAAGEYFLLFPPTQIAFPQMLEKLAAATWEAEAEVVVCPQARKGEGEEIKDINLIDGNLLKLLDFKANYDLTALFKLDFLRQFPYCTERNLQALNWQLFACAIATNTPIAYYPYPLYCIDAKIASITPESYPKERYYLRQYLLQIEPSQWNQRQINLLLTGFEQLLQSPPQPAAVTQVNFSSPQNQAWHLTAQQLYQELSQTQSELASLKEWQQQLQAGKDWLESQWQAWLLRSQKAEWEWQRWYNLVQEMQKSKFWRLRNKWFKLKQKLGRVGKDPLQTTSLHNFTPGVQEFVTRIAGQKIRFFQPEAPETPLVSLISTCFADYHYLETTYRTLVNQTWQNWEWLIVDDGAEEETKALLTTLSQRTGKIRILSQPSHQGKAASYNNAIAQARGKYCCFLDLGAIIDPTYLEKGILFLKTHPQVAFLNSYSVVFQGREHWWNTPLNQPQAILNQDGIWSHPIYRQTDLEALGNFDESLQWFAEWELCLKAIAKGKIGWTIPEYLDCYRATETTTPTISPHHTEAAKAEIRGIKARYQESFHSLPKISLESQPLHLETLKFTISPLVRTKQENPGKRLLLLCPNLDNNDIARWNCELVKLLVQQGYEIAIATTTPSNHTLQEFFYPTTPEIFHLSNLDARSHWLAFTRYLISSRQSDILLISGGDIAYYFLPLLRAEFPQLTLLDYTHPNYSPEQNSPITTRQFTQYLDYQLVSSHHQAQEYRQLNGSHPAKIKVCYTLTEVESAIREAMAIQRTKTPRQNKFEVEQEVLPLLLEYLQQPPTPTIQETETPPELSGRELVKLLLKKVLKL